MTEVWALSHSLLCLSPSISESCLFFIVPLLNQFTEHPACVWHCAKCRGDKDDVNLRPAFMIYTLMGETDKEDRLLTQSIFFSLRRRLSTRCPHFQLVPLDSRMLQLWALLFPSFPFCLALIPSFCLRLLSLFMFLHPSHSHPQPTTSLLWPLLLSLLQCCQFKHAH